MNILGKKSHETLWNLSSEYIRSLHTIIGEQLRLIILLRASPINGMSSYKVKDYCAGSY